MQTLIRSFRLVVFLKRLSRAGLVFALLFAKIDSLSALSVSDDFSYPATNLASASNDGGGGFSAAWGGSTWADIDAAANLSISGVTGYGIEQTATGRVSTSVSPPDSSLSTRGLAGSGFVGTSSGLEVWFSVLVESVSGSMDGRTGLYFNADGTNRTSADAGFLLVGNDFRRLAAGTLVSTGLTLGMNATHLVVGRIVLKDTGPSTVSLWLDPSDVSSISALGAASVTFSADFGGAVTNVGIESYGYTPGAGQLDVLRVSDGEGNAATALATVVTSEAPFPVLFISEDFSYSAGDLVSPSNSGGTGFSGAWEGSSQTDVVSSANLLLSGITGYEVAQTTTGRIDTSIWPGDSMLSTRNFSDDGFVGTAAGRDVWFSILVECRSGGTDGRAGIYFNVDGTHRTDADAGFLLVGNDFRQLTAGTLTSTGQTLALNAVHLVVGRVVLKDSGPSTVSLWLDPSNMSSIGALGAADVTYAAYFGGALTNVGAESYGNAPGAGRLDALRISDGGGDSDLALSHIAGSEVPEPPPVGAGLSVTYGPQGVLYLGYNNVPLVDGSLNPYDPFFIENVGFRRPDGTTYSWYWWNGAYQRVMDYTQNRINWVFAWGIISCQYTKVGDKLVCAITVQNDSTDTITGVSCHPLQVHFPDTKPPELDNGLVHVGLSYQGPVAIRASFNGGVMVVSDETPAKHTYVGLHGSDMGGGLPGHVYKFHANAHAWWWYPSDLPRFYTSIASGTSYSYTVSARFAAAGTPTKDIVPDVYEAYRGAYPYQLYWNDRRPIARLFLSSYGSGVAGDPRGWIFYDPAVDGDIATTTGKANFRTKLLALADGAVTRAQSINAQGVLTWDIEGQEWWHPISYIGDPSQAEDFAPELAYKPTPSDLSTVDAYFKKFTDAGLTPGVTIRPQTMVRTVSGTTVTAQQVEATAATSPSFQQNVIDKAEYARDRWGCRILYVDTNVINATLGDPPPVYEAALTAVPDVLFIPEWSRVRTYAASAPYGAVGSTVGIPNYGTPQNVLDVYPQAFCAMAPGATTQIYDSNWATLRDAVRRGDILMFDGWWDNPTNAKTKNLYLDAGLTPVSTGGYNGSFEKDLDSDGQADGWGRARENTVTAAAGTYYVRPTVTTGANPTFIYTDVKRYANIPFKYTGSPMTLSASVRDTTNAQFDSFQYYIEISWEEGGTTYTANTFNSWSSTGAKNTTSWRPLQWTAAISGLTSNGHSIVNGTNHRITFLQLRCGDATSTQANTLYEMLVDDFAVSYTP